jgi:PAS domain S-box-containing protein
MIASRPISLTATLEKVKVPSIVSDENGVVTWLNGAAKEAFGDVTGESMFGWIAPEDLPLVLRERERKRRGAPVTDYEIDVFTRDGRRRRAEVSSVRIRGGDEYQAFFGIVVLGPRRLLPAPAPLTPRQAEVLRLLGEGASTADIAASLHLSTETVRNHVRNVLRALGAHSRLEAVAVAHANGLFPE